MCVRFYPARTRVSDLFHYGFNLVKPTSLAGYGITCGMFEELGDTSTAARMSLPSTSTASTTAAARATATTTITTKRRKKSGADLDKDAQTASNGGNDSSQPEKKVKACHACRRCKLRCVPAPDGGPCERCVRRGEECVYTTPLHDLKWQQSIENRVEHLTTTVDYLVTVIGSIANQLSVPFDPPAQTSRTQLVPVIGPAARTSPPPFSNTTEPTRKRPRSVSVDASSSSSRRIQAHSQPPPEHSYLTQSGAEELLLQAYARFDLPFSMEQEMPSIPAPVQDSQVTQMTNQTVGANNLFDLIDMVTKPSQQIAQSDPRHVDAGSTSASGMDLLKPMSARLLGSTDLEAVGSQDPRQDVVKQGLVSSGDAEVLLDFFHAQLAPHLCGFVLRMRAWPYLPTGKSNITPLILGSICLVAAERIPRFHSLLDKLESSDLRDSILNATPGLSFAPGSDSSKQNGLEPDLDLELGIGPEEISALLVYASLSHSTRSDQIARTAFEWTRGYLKTFMLPSPPPVTYGEVFGLLPARRDLTFENWLRLWLFGYVIDIQQSLHQENLAPVFDPHYFCDTLLVQSANSPSLIDQQHDRELVAHARLCAIMQRVQYTRAALGWSSASTTDVIAAANSWNSELDRWWSEQDLTLTAIDISLTMFKFFASLFVNLPTSKEDCLRESKDRWSFRSLSVQTAWQLLLFVRDEPQAGDINVLLPFFVKMILLSAVIVLDSFQDTLFMLMPCTLDSAMSTVRQISDNLSRAPVPSQHPCLTASVNLRKALARANENYLGSRNISGI
ncbi:hypothetical protein OIO90_004398 [Microbotryomycetes sp. JL221]|nr:hypothetical protein OIO90_004398 [Microbotryomycetes sp. JL221]